MLKKLFFIFISFLAAIVFKISITESYNYTEYNFDVERDSTTPPVVNDSSLFIARLDEGKQLYKKKCSTCHTLYKPKDFKLKIWKENLEEMKIKADLSKKEYDLILEYLTENCKK